MQSLLRAYQDDDEPISGYSEPKAGLGRGLLGEEPSHASYYQTRGHSRMLWIGGFLICVGIIPLVSFSPHAGSLMHKSENDVIDDAALLSTRNHTEQHEIGDDDFTISRWKDESNIETTTSPEFSIHTTIKPSTAKPTRAVPTSKSKPVVKTVVQSKVESVKPTPKNEKTQTDSTSSHKKPSHKPSTTQGTHPQEKAQHHVFTIPPECTAQEMEELRLGHAVSTSCRNAYNSAVVEEGGRIFAAREVALGDMPAECTARDIELLKNSSKAILSTACSNAYEKIRKVKLSNQLKNLENEVSHMKAILHDANTSDKPVKP